MNLAENRLGTISILSLVLMAGLCGPLCAEELSGELDDQTIFGPVNEADVRTWLRGRSRGVGSDTQPNWSAVASNPRNDGHKTMVTVYFGTWCHDSKREIPRFLEFMDRPDGFAPFSTRFILVNSDKTEPSRFLAQDKVKVLPTLVVTRDGKELGRIVERAPRGLAKDLEMLLSGKSHGLVSASEYVIRQYLFSEGQPSDEPEAQLAASHP